VSDMRRVYFQHLTTDAAFILGKDRLGRVVVEVLIDETPHEYRVSVATSLGGGHGLVVEQRIAGTWREIR
jgi:hypothetical protein